MMRNYFTILLLLISSICFGQYKDFDEIKSKPFTNNSFNLMGVLTFGKLNDNKILFLNADTGTKKMTNVIVNPLKNKSFVVYLEGATTINLRSSLSNDSLNYYKYTVTNGDGLIIGKRDMSPLAMETKNKMDTVIADFGMYKVANQNLTISIYKSGELKNKRELIIINKRLKPVELIEANLVDFYKTPRIFNVKKDYKGDTIYSEMAVSNSVNLNVKGSIMRTIDNPSYAQISIKPIENVFLYKIMINRRLGNKVFIDLIDDVNWGYDERNNISTRLDKKYFKEPGKYEIIIFPKIGIVRADKEENATKINFEIAKTPSTLKDWLWPVIIGAICGSLIVYMKGRQMKKRIKEEKQQKEIAKTQLDSVRLQLNPHFMFNALAGIQSLMNEHKIDEANKYLGKFARITRNVLDNKELISLAEERSLLDDYLQMEQLRFGFNYQINIQPDVDLNIEIPAMLLQPFLENAVKHGIAEKEKEGEIIINFMKADDSLLLELIDNGKGFDTSKTYPGYGLQLSKNRITLLNTIYKENTLVLDTKTDAMVQ